MTSFLTTLVCAAEAIRSASDADKFQEAYHAGHEHEETAHAELVGAAASLRSVEVDFRELAERYENRAATLKAKA